VIAAAFLLCATSARAVPPVVDSIFPAGGQRGATVAIAASGKLEVWPVKIWTDSPGLRFEAGEKSGTLTAHVAADAPLGPHLIRFYTADGASALRCFMVGDQSEVAEAEPNDESAKAQAVKELPVTINGQLERSGDVDCYAVQLQAGQCLVASVQGRRLGSAIDPMLHLVSEDGTQLAFVHDGLGLDPLLVYRAEKTGRFIVRVSAFAYPPAAEVKLAGGKDAVYQSHFAFRHNAWPKGDAAADWLEPAIRSHRSGCDGRPGGGRLSVHPRTWRRNTAADRSWRWYGGRRIKRSLTANSHPAGEREWGDCFAGR
jgi:hypothetical protein